MDFLQFGATVIGQTTLLAAAGFLIRALVGNALERDATTFKAQLQRDGDAFRSALELEAHRQNTTFSRLHEDRARKIEEVYRLLATAENAERSMIAPMQMVGEPNHAEKAQACYAALTALQNALDASRIWFTEETCAKADAVATELRAIHNRFNIIVMQRDPGNAALPNAEEWGRTWERFEQNVPEFKTALENDFRKLLGVTSAAAEGQ